jgi:MerR family transcriptional regulator, light-induced transcriptional regulator
MNDRIPAPNLSRTIAAVERDTGLSKDTLRVWERRYGFPSPDRDSLGERLYPIDQVEKLRVLRRLMDTGHRPGKIVGLSIDALRALAADAAGKNASGVSGAAAAPGGDAAELHRYIDLVKGHRVDEFRRALSEAQLRVGIERFVVDMVAPLTRMVGEAWVSGRIAVFEEHLYTESVQAILRTSINAIPQPEGGPRVLLTTIPQEPHGLGLLMAEAILALEGCRCLSLGVQTPVWDIVMAAGAHQADVVALSFSASLNGNQVLAALDELRRKLPAAVEVWAGGGCPILERRPPTGVLVLTSLAAIQPAVSAWRAAHPR